MKGDTTPGVSAGSNRVGASEKRSPQVSRPSGAALARPGTVNVSSSTASRTRWLNAGRAFPSSGIEDDLPGGSGPLLEGLDGLVHACQRELVGDERLGREPA